MGASEKITAPNKGLALIEGILKGGGAWLKEQQAQQQKGDELLRYILPTLLSERGKTARHREEMGFKEEAQEWRETEAGREWDFRLKQLDITSSQFQMTHEARMAEIKQDWGIAKKEATSREDIALADRRHEVRLMEMTQDYKVMNDRISELQTQIRDAQTAVYRMQELEVTEAGATTRAGIGAQATLGASRIGAAATIVTAERRERGETTRHIRDLLADAKTRAEARKDKTKVTAIETSSVWMKLLSEDPSNETLQIATQSALDYVESLRVPGEMPLPQIVPKERKQWWFDKEGYLAPREVALPPPAAAALETPTVRLTPNSQRILDNVMNWPVGERRAVIERMRKTIKNQDRNMTDAQINEVIKRATAK